MASLLPLLINYGPLLSAALVILGIYFIFVGLTSLRDLNRAVFGMERTSVASRAASAWVRAGLCVLLALGIYAVTALLNNRPTTRPSQSVNILLNASPTPRAGIVLPPTSAPTADFSQMPQITPTFVIQAAQAIITQPQVAGAEATAILETPTPPPTETPIPPTATNPPPTLPAITLAPTTVVLASVPTAAPAAATAAPTTVRTQTANATANAKATATLVVVQLPTVPIVRVPSATPVPTQPVEVPTPVQEPLPPPDCADPGTVGILSPQHGQTVNGQVQVFGNAGIDFNNSGYAKVEVLLPSGWGYLGRIDVPTREGNLAVLSTNALRNGPNQIRLILVDKNGREGAKCQISIRVQN